MGLHVRFLSVALASAGFAFSAGAREFGPGRYAVSIAEGGYDREYSVHVPTGYRAGRALPLVLLLHGAGGSGKTMLDRNGWASKADREGFLAVAPDGLPAFPDRPVDFRRNPRVWNSGQLRSDGPHATIDDVRFLTAVLDDIARRLGVDPARVFVAGHSNGGGMVFRLAAEQSRRLSAIASVSALCWVDDPRPARAVPTLVIIGREDPLVPLAGGQTRSPWGDSKRVPPLAQNLAIWAKAMGCTSRPELFSRDGGVEVQRYRGLGGKTVLVSKVIDGQGHTWPGLDDHALPVEVVGPVSLRMNATDAVWDFFSTVGGPNPAPVANRPSQARPTDPPPPPLPVPPVDPTPPPPPTPSPNPGREPDR